MNIKTILTTGLTVLSLGLYTSCEDLMNTSSTFVTYTEDQWLDQPVDTVYSVMGIIGRMQGLADRTVLLGEIRGELTDLTTHASNDLKELADFNVGSDNAYNSAADYYAVINNCNFFLARVDTAVKKRNEYVFMKEYAAVKTFRAWTYLQLVTTYGSVPFITEPVLTEAAANKDYPMYDIRQVCDYFIQDLAPLVNVPIPGYGIMNNLDSKKFFLPTRVVLGDLCLWGQYYREAAGYYHDYLTLEDNPISVGLGQIVWDSENTSFNNVLNAYSSQFASVSSTEAISFIPMETTVTDAAYSQLSNVFNSTVSNKYYNQAGPSAKLMELSKAQSNCIVYTNNSVTDTIFAPTTNVDKPLWVGDLRLSAVYTVQNGVTASQGVDGNPTTGSLYSSRRQSISKHLTGHVVVYRRGQIYLRYAEALNRAGFSQSAFAVLKYGLYPSNVAKYVSESERSAAGNLIAFDQYNFSSTNTMGIHSKGSGNAAANRNYVIPANVDTILAVEDLICDEYALETAFEGGRFYDLVRMATNRNDKEWLAAKVAARKGTRDQSLYDLLKNDNSKWFLPLK